MPAVQRPGPLELHDLEHCFACGSANPRGIGLTFHLEAPGRVWAETGSDLLWSSWRGLMHGGLLASLMDEAMGWAAGSTGRTALTARLQVRLRRPVAPGQRLRVRAWLRGEGHGLLQAAAQVLLPSGTVVAEGQATLRVVEQLPEPAR